MDRRLAVSVLVVLAAGCQGDVQNPATPGNAPSFVISDGAHGQVGNPDFFFLPPLVPNPRHSPNWSPDGFNAGLQPTVTVCALDLPSTAQESDVQFGTPCRSGGYAVSFPFVTSGNDGVRLHAPRNGDEDDDADDDGDRGGHYHVKWRAPTSSDAFYRVRVLVGTTVLGFADVHSVTGGKDLKNVNTGEFIARKDGQTAQIKFRIENRALCANPGGTDPCATAVVNLGTGGTVSVVTNPLDAPSGVGFPPQNTQTQPVTVTVQTCPDLNPRVIDLPTYGGCLHVSTTPLLAQPLDPPATVFICDYPPDVSALPHTQEERVTLHRLRSDNVVEAVPHGQADCTPPVVGALGQLRGAVRSLVRGDWGSAGEQLASLVGPTPLMALHRGGGGLVAGFSDFQFALPCKMQITAGDGQTVPAGSTLPVNPTVLVTDLGDEPCPGARVSFSGNGSATPGTVVTAVDGLASTAWTIGTGSNQLIASGRGIAGANADGPRSIFDPFMAIEPYFNPANDPVPNPLMPVSLQTGTQTFHATGTNTLVAYGSGGWKFQRETTPPPGWEQPGYDDSAYSLGTAAFGSPSGCALNAGVVTDWPINRGILLRRTLTLPTTATLRIAVAIDNDVQVYLDGVDVSGGLRTHDGCPTLDSFVFTVSGVSAGSHVLAVRGLDRGGSSYLDVEVKTQ